MSTTVRNPERLVSFLRVLKELEGVDFTKDIQMKYQTLLIQERVYGFGNPQFYNASGQCKALTREQIQLIESMEPITYDQAKEIFESKDYEDPPMRGRQSVNPLNNNKLVFLV